MSGEKRQNRIDDLDEKLLKRLRKSFENAQIKKERKACARREEKGLNKVLSKAGEGLNMAGDSFLGKVCKEGSALPKEAVSLIVWPALRAAAPLILVSFGIGVLLQSSLIPLLTFGVMGVFLLLVVGVRLFYAKRDIKAYYGFITGWKRDNSPANVVKRLLSADDLLIQKVAFRQSEQAKKYDIAAYMAQVDGFKKPFRIPVQKTNRPLPIGTIIRVWAGGEAFETKDLFTEKRQMNFARVYGIKDLDIEAEMEDFALDYLPGSDAPVKLVYVNDPALPSKQEALGGPEKGAPALGHME